MITRITIFLSAIVLCSACSDTKPSQSPWDVVSKKRDFQVSVTSNGEEVADFKSDLVHRLALTYEQMERIFVSETRQLNLPCGFLTEYDLRGEVSGLRIVDVQPSEEWSLLGFLENDLLTAVGRSHVTKKEDLWSLYRLLRLHRQATLTLERNGRPHKIFYSVTSTPDVS